MQPSSYASLGKLAANSTAMWWLLAAFALLPPTYGARCLHTTLKWFVGVALSFVWVGSAVDQALLVGKPPFAVVALGYGTLLLWWTWMQHLLRGVAVHGIITTALAAGKWSPGVHARFAREVQLVAGVLVVAIVALVVFPDAARIPRARDPAGTAAFRFFFAYALAAVVCTFAAFALPLRCLVLSAVAIKHRLQDGLLDDMSALAEFGGSGDGGSAMNTAPRSADSALPVPEVASVAVDIGARGGGLTAAAEAGAPRSNGSLFTTTSAPAPGSTRLATTTPAPMASATTRRSMRVAPVPPLATDTTHPRLSQAAATESAQVTSGRDRATRTDAAATGRTLGGVSVRASTTAAHAAVSDGDRNIVAPSSPNPVVRADSAGSQVDVTATGGPAELGSRKWGSAASPTHAVAAGGMFVHMHTVQRSASPPPHDAAAYAPTSPSPPATCFLSPSLTGAAHASRYLPAPSSSPVQSPSPPAHEPAHFPVAAVVGILSGGVSPAAVGGQPLVPRELSAQLSLLHGVASRQTSDGQGASVDGRRRRRPSAGSLVSASWMRSPSRPRRARSRSGFRMPVASAGSNGDAMHVDAALDDLQLLREAYAQASHVYGPLIVVVTTCFIAAGVAICFTAVAQADNSTLFYGAFMFALAVAMQLMAAFATSAIGAVLRSTLTMPSLRAWHALSRNGARVVALVDSAPTADCISAYGTALDGSTVVRVASILATVTAFSLTQL